MQQFLFCWLFLCEDPQHRKCWLNNELDSSNYYQSIVTLQQSPAISHFTYCMSKTIDVIFHKCPRYLTTDRTSFRSVLPASIGNTKVLKQILLSSPDDTLAHWFNIQLVSTSQYTQVIHCSIMVCQQQYRCAIFVQDPLRCLPIAL